MRDERTRAFSRRSPQRQFKRSIDTRLTCEDWYHICILSFLSRCSFSLFCTFCSAIPLKCLLVGRDNDGNYYHSSIPHSLPHLPLFRDVDDVRVSSRTSFSSHRYTEEVKILFSRNIAVPSRGTTNVSTSEIEMPRD